MPRVHLGWGRLWLPSPSYSIRPIFWLRRLRSRDREHLALVVHVSVSAPASPRQGNLEGSDPAWVISLPSAMYNILPGFQLQIPQLGTNYSFLEEQVPRPQTQHNRCFLNTRTIGRERLSCRLNSSSRPAENVSSQSSFLTLFQPVLEDGLQRLRPGLRCQQRPREGPAPKLGLEPVPRTRPGPLPPALAQRRGFLSYPASALDALSPWMPLLKGRWEPSRLCSPLTPFGDYFLNTCLVPGAVPGTGGT